jgi:hypothetical protein
VMQVLDRVPPGGYAEDRSRTARKNAKPLNYRHSDYRFLSYGAALGYSTLGSGLAGNTDEPGIW